MTTRSFRRVIITGAASDIGRAFSRTLAAEGSALGLLDVAADPLRATALELGGDARVRTVVVDVSDRAAVDAGIATLASELGGLDLGGEGQRYDAWMKAFEEHGLDPLFYTHRQRRTDEVVPWEHITAAVRKNFLFQDFRQSLEGQIRVDCRLNCFACGILPTFANMRRRTRAMSGSVRK